MSQENEKNTEFLIPEPIPLLKERKGGGRLEKKRRKETGEKEEGNEEGRKEIREREEGNWRKGGRKLEKGSKGKTVMRKRKIMKA